jgi:hypothetical protein
MATKNNAANPTVSSVDPHTAKGKAEAMGGKNA